MSYKFTFELTLRAKETLQSTPPPGDDCCICLDSSGGEWVKLDCHHVFHKSCLLTYISSSPYQRCPLCRSPLRERDDECTIL